MTTYDVRGGTSETSEIIILPSDVYRMKIVSATIEDDQFNVQKDGTPEKKFVIVWEVSALTTEQQEAADDDADLEAYIGQKVWQRFAPFYREKRAGGPTNFKAFIDSLRDQGHLEGFDPGNFDPEDLLDIEQRVSVLQYTKTMGDNAGKPGNKVAGVMPLKRKKGKTAETKAEKNTPQTIETDDANHGNAASNTQPRAAQSAPPQRQAAPATNGSGDKATDAQLRAIWAAGKAAGIDAEGLKAEMTRRFGIDKSGDLSRTQASELIDWIKSVTPETADELL